MSERDTAAPAKNLVCPYCGDTLEVVLEYTGFAHSEHRDHTGFACDNYACDARWGASGLLTDAPFVRAET